MKRRQILATGAGTAAIGISGCINALEVSGEENGDDHTEGDVSGCTQKEEWKDTQRNGSEDPDPDSIAGRRNCATADRPEPTGDICTEHEIEIPDEETYESAGIELYPDPPSTFDEETVTAFVHEYEIARSRNHLVKQYGDRLLEGQASIEEDNTHVSNDGKISVIRIQFSIHYETVSPDGRGISTTDPAPSAAVYGVDETGIVRAEAEYADQIDEDVLDETPDPVEEGNLLECF